MSNHTNKVAATAVNEKTNPITHNNKPISAVRSRMTWVPSTEFADWWYVFSWKGIIWSLVFTAVAACSALIFTLIQFWADGVRDEQSTSRHKFLEAQTEVAKAESSKANAEAAKANEAAVNATLELEKERARRLEIEARLAPRFLDAQQINSFVESLRQHSGEAIFLKTNGRDREAVNFATQLLTALTTAGWHTKIWSAPDSSVDLASGLLLEIFDGATDATKASAVSLKAALEVHNFEVTLGSETVGNPTAYLRLVVGRKP